MKNQALFSLKGKNKKIKFCLLQLLFGGLRVKMKILFAFRNLMQIECQTM